jgi:hypothetical protein
LTAIEKLAGVVVLRAGSGPELDAITILAAEVRRLRALVHSAWEEAYDAGQSSTEGIPKVWLSSDTRKQLGAP